MSTQINLSGGNENFISLKLAESRQDWVNLGLKNLPKEDAKALKLIAPIIFGAELNDDQSIVSAKYTNGKFDRLRPPAVFTKEGVLGTKLGRDFFPFDLESIANSSITVSVESVKLDKFDDLSLVFTYEIPDSDDYVIFPLPFAIKKDVEVDKVKFTGWVRKAQYNKLSEFLYEVGSGSGSGSSAPMKHISELVVGQAYKIVKARKVQASYGVSWILNLSDSNGDTFDMWAPYQAKNWLNLGAQVSDKSELIISGTYINKKGATAYEIDITGFEVPKNENHADLDGLF